VEGAADENKKIGLMRSRFHGPFVISKQESKLSYSSYGFSAGGQLAALVGTTNDDPALEGADCSRSHSNRVQAIVDIDGTLSFIHPELGEGDDSKSISAATRWFGASKTQPPEVWHQAEVLNHVSAHTPPILFVNSSVDRMHAGCDDIIKKLDALHIYHEQHAFPSVLHTFPLFNP
jgi:pectinesterase